VTSRIQTLTGAGLFIFSGLSRSRGMPQRTLLTQAARKALPKLYSQDGKGEAALCQVKFFTPDSSWTWYASEFDGEDTFFGLCDDGRGGAELGYFSLRELQSVRGPMGLKVERDNYWTPKPLSECRQ